MLVASWGPLKGAVLSRKALQGSKTNKRELLEFRGSLIWNCPPPKAMARSSLAKRSALNISKSRRNLMAHFPPRLGFKVSSHMMSLNKAKIVYYRKNWLRTLIPIACVRNCSWEENNRTLLLTATDRSKNHGFLHDFFFSGVWAYR